MTDPTLLVGVGGVLGALARHLLVAVPVADSLLLLFGTGFCGAFTTFSTFAFETVFLFETGERRRAVAAAALNLGGALAAVALGTVVAGAVT